ncbi:hypothetical protein T4A_1514, partial [Trichinella pseudospiralis]
LNFAETTGREGEGSFPHLLCCLTEHIEGKVACFDQFTSIIIVFSFDGGVFCHFISANMKMIIFTLDRFACKRSVYYDLRQMLFPQLVFCGIFKFENEKKGVQEKNHVHNISTCITL